LSNYRVRQALALRLPDRQNRFLCSLATFMTDDSRIARAGFDAVMEAAGQARNTARTARRELETGGKLASKRGDGRGNLTLWIVLCLPEVSPRTTPQAEKGVSNSDPLSSVHMGVSDVDPLSETPQEPKGGQRPPERGSTTPEKGGQAQSAEQPERDRGLNRLAKPSGSRAASALIRSAFPDATDDEIESIIANKEANGARSVFSVVRYELAQSALRLPCNPRGESSHSDACRSGDSARCSHKWCECRCHVRPAAATS
jgi:hypothetical protein